VVDHIIIWMWENQ